MQSKRAAKAAAHVGPSAAQSSVPPALQVPRLMPEWYCSIMMHHRFSIECALGAHFTWFSRSLCSSSHSTNVVETARTGHREFSRLVHDILRQHAHSDSVDSYKLHAVVVGRRTVRSYAAVASAGLSAVATCLRTGALPVPSFLSIGRAVVVVHTCWQSQPNDIADAGLPHGVLAGPSHKRTSRRNACATGWQCSCVRSLPHLRRPQFPDKAAASPILRVRAHANRQLWHGTGR